MDVVISKFIFAMGFKYHSVWDSTESVSRDDSDYNTQL